MFVYRPLEPARAMKGIIFMLEALCSVLSGCLDDREPIQSEQPIHDKQRNVSHTVEVRPRGE